MGGRGRGRGLPDFSGGAESILLGGRGAQQGNRPPPKLVIPGKGPGPGQGGPGGRLVFPDSEANQMVADGAAALGPEMVTMTGPNRYRPPAGFMNEDGPQDNSKLSSMSPEEMVNKLRSRAGRWHNLAKMFPILNQQGYDSATIDEMSGITPALQNRWLVASTVYDSLVAADLPADMLARFDSRGEDLLYPFRFLTQDMRVEAAQYIIKNDLDPTACDVLARSMKEWERRPGERSGFSDKPGDCLAFKYLRDAFECRRLEDAEVKMDQAFAAAVTDGAKARLTEALQTLRGETGGSADSGPVSGPTGLANLMILRLDPEELGFRPIPVLGNLGQATAGDLEAAPRTTQEGAFGTFDIVGQGAACKWVALPQWKALAMMRHPVAINIVDCVNVPAIVQGTKVKTDDDRKRLSGAGLVVADKVKIASDNVDTNSYYLVQGPGTKLELMEGAQVQARGITTLATVVFVARPPIREQPAIGSDLLQL